MTPKPLVSAGLTGGSPRRIHRSTCSLLTVSTVPKLPGLTKAQTTRESRANSSSLRSPTSGIKPSPPFSLLPIEPDVIDFEPRRELDCRRVAAGIPADRQVQND